MIQEFRKIDYYFEQGKMLWPNNPDLVLSRDFYELWEQYQCPVPFKVNSPSLELFGLQFKLPGNEQQWIGSYIWLPEEECACLKLESENWLQTYLLTFEDGSPRIYENDPVPCEKDDMEHGERLEIIYDVIAYVNQHSPGKDVISMTKKEYLEVLDAIQQHHDKRSISTMRRLSVMFLKKLLKEATSDMATDELSSQLSLPLDGSYASAGTEEEERLTGRPRKLEYPNSRRTAWSAINELNFLHVVRKLQMENEKLFILDFKSAEIIGEPYRQDVPLKLAAEPDMPLTQGEILNVYCRGERDVFGTFKIDIFDGNAIFGRLRYDQLKDTAPEFGQLFARLQRSPYEFIALMVEQLYLEIKKQADSAKLGVLETILGLKPLVSYDGIAPSAPNTLDSSQKRAWTNAVNPENPVVLIQGPPGTGKTFVLENVVRKLCAAKKRILVTAPSNTAVDNICRRIADELPVLRIGNNQHSIAPDVAKKCWVNNPSSIQRFKLLRETHDCGTIYAGTHVGLLRDELVNGDLEQNGKYDAIVFDEAGMARVDVFMLCAMMGKRAILFGDHQQLPPFPLPHTVIEKLEESYGPVSANLNALINGSALEWLADERSFPVVMLKQSYRCQNPRLLRFASTLFYEAAVKASEKAEYYQLSYHERKRKYPKSKLRLYSTSELPPHLNCEQLIFEGHKPGLANPAEALLCCYAFYQALRDYPLSEITIIAPYRKQVKLIQENLSLEKARSVVPDRNITKSDWDEFVFSRIATVDSFQGGESDIVIICYVRSNDGGGIGFVDNANRINVAQTRCRREMHIIGNIECLKKQAQSRIFERMERAFRRDGEVITVTEYMLKEIAETLAPTISN